MNEALNILKQFKPNKTNLSNHVIAHLSLKDEKPIQLFGSKNNVRKQ